MNFPALREQLILDEGLKLKPYKDTVGKLTVGVGRNLDDVGISKDEVLYLLDNDIKRAVQNLDDIQPWWRELNDIRQNVLINMCFNMGIGKLSGFKNALAAMKAGDFNTAAEEMRNSAWAKQVGQRADRLIQLMRSGK